MSVLTGEVVDYVVRSKVCFECQLRKSWEKDTQSIVMPLVKSLVINHTKSSEPMEKDAELYLLNFII